MVEMVVEELEAFQDPDPTKGTVAAVKRRQSMYASSAEFDAKWMAAIASIQNPPTC